MSQPHPPSPSGKELTRVGFAREAMCSLRPLPGRERAEVRVPAHGASSPLTQTLSPSGGEGDQGGRPCPVTPKNLPQKAGREQGEGQRAASRADATPPDAEANIVLEALSRRVERLEQANWQWKRLASGALAALAIVGLLGAATGKRDKNPPEVRAQRLVLVDKADKARAELTVVSDDQPALLLVDHAGKPRLMLALSKYGEPTLSFADAGGTRRLVLSLDLYGTMLRLTDDAGNPRAALVVPSAGEPEIELLSQDDKVLWHAP